LSGTHAGGLNVVGNELSQSVLIDALSETTGPIEVDLGSGADTVEVSSDHFARLEGGDGIDRFVMNSQTTFELFEYISGRVFGFEQYVLQTQGPATTQVDLDRLGQFTSSGEAAVLDLYVQGAEQFKVFGESWYGSPEMVGDRFAQVVVSDGGRLRVVSERPWQNVKQPSDTNHDGDVSVLDALVVLNHLAVYGSDLPETPTLADFGGVFLDVTGDGLATALDSLRVLNHLAARAGAEGEGAELPMVRDFMKSHESERCSTLQDDQLPSSREPSVIKVVSTSHPADEAIRDLYYSPEATAEISQADAIESSGDSWGLKIVI
ncbi:MAG: dockerin type I domain-containing protein, partial [Rubripirellula sp.]